MEIIKKLGLLGLTEGEAKVYISVLEGNSTKTAIVKNSGVSSSIVYELLGKLTKKGLVTSVVKDGKKVFQANEPSILLEFIENEESGLKKKKRLAKELIPVLKKGRADNLSISVYEGIDGLKRMLKEVEEYFKESKPKEWLAMGITGKKRASFNRYWLHWHTHIRPKYNVKAKIIFSEKETDYFRNLRKTPLAKAKFLPMDSPTCATVAGELLLLMKYGDPPVFILIRNKEVAETLRSIFKALWEAAA